MTNDNAARIAGHLDAALVALQTAQDDLALAAELALTSGSPNESIRVYNSDSLRHMSSAVLVAKRSVNLEQRRWIELLEARESKENK